MPAMLDDPTSPAIKRETVPADLQPRILTLKDGVTKATLIPFTSLSQAPPTLVAYLHAALAKEIEAGDTYPMLDPLPLETFGPYWFGMFAAVMLLGEYQSTAEIATMQDANWTELCLGSFYIKPNYPGRSSHVCNAGFLVAEASRGKGAGKLMGKAYLDWAPKLVSHFTFFEVLLRWITRADIHRAIRTLCSTWCTRPMRRHAEFGTRLASKGLEGSRNVGN
jgi:hypothetical protein